MAHPFAGQAQSSLKRRLRALNATAGKSWGSSKMYKRKSLPKTHAGSSTPMTISGGSSRPRADRLASGGAVGRKRRGHSTTNIIISHAGGQGGTGAGGGGATARPAMPVPAPVPVPRPVPVPAGAAAPVGPGPAGPAALPPRPPMVAPAGPPVAAGPPPGAMPMRPPGMKAGGAVKKAAKGGFLRESAGKSYPGFPHSPTSKTKSAVSAHKKGGVVGGFKQGGIARRADGGPAANAGTGSVASGTGSDLPWANNPPPIGPGTGGMGIGAPLGVSGPGPLRADSGSSGDSGAIGGGGETDVGGGGGGAPPDTDVTIQTGRAALGVPKINTNIDKLVEDALAGRQRKRGGTVSRRQEGGTTPPPDIQVSDQVVAGTSGGGLGPDAGESDTGAGRRKYSDTPKLGGDYKGGGGVKKRQMGGGAMGSSFGSSGQPQQQQGGLFGPGPGRGPTPAIQGPPTISGRPARPAMPLTVPQPPTLAARMQRPAPGMTVGYKKGGKVPPHDDEAQDRKLIRRMIKEEDKDEGMKRKRGGSVRDWGKGSTKTSGGSMSPRLPPGEKYHQQGKGYADGGAVHGAGSAAGRLARSKVSGKAEL